MRYEAPDHDLDPPEPGYRGVRGEPIEDLGPRCRCGHLEIDHREDGACTGCLECEDYREDDTGEGQR